MAEYTMSADVSLAQFKDECRSYGELEIFYWMHPLHKPRSHTCPSVKSGATNASITREETPVLGGEWMD
jgi:hypothetical protein